MGGAERRRRARWQEMGAEAEGERVEIAVEAINAAGRRL